MIQVIHFTDVITITFHWDHWRWYQMSQCLLNAVFLFHSGPHTVYPSRPIFILFWPGISSPVYLHRLPKMCKRNRGAHWSHFYSSVMTVLNLHPRNAETATTNFLTTTSLWIKELTYKKIKISEELIPEQHSDSHGLESQTLGQINYTWLRDYTPSRN